MINIHLVLASFFLPYLLLMPLTGSLYIWGFTGDQQKTEVFRITDAVPEDKDAQETFFREQFAKNGARTDFEYIRSNKTDFTFRPTTRDHYMASREGEGLTVYEIKPTFLRGLIEMHKGHGPVYMRWLQSVFGVFLILVTLSGLWLSITVPAYRKATLIAFAGGLLVIAFGLF